MKAGTFASSLNSAQSFQTSLRNVRIAGTMMTKIFHPNMSKAGEICVDTLKKGWKKEYGVGHVLVTIKCLLIYPNPESALDEEAGKQLLADYEGYCKYARLMTSIHATPRLPPAEFRESSSTASSSKSTPASSTSHLMPSQSSRPPNSTSSTTSSSSSAARPAPLGAHAGQAPSPVIEQDGRIGGDLMKPTKTVPVKTAPASKAKRGLKRL
ncbi:hypothetical protein P7C73_g5180, partial [Tremellales sp. Uapishka_1]